jgi:hypothetical protein
MPYEKAAVNNAIKVWGKSDIKFGIVLRRQQHHFQHNAEQHILLH